MCWVKGGSSGGLVWLEYRRRLVSHPLPLFPSTSILYIFRTTLLSCILSCLTIHYHASFLNYQFITVHPLLFTNLWSCILLYLPIYYHESLYLPVYYHASSLICQFIIMPPFLFTNLSCIFSYLPTYHTSFLIYHLIIMHPLPMTQPLQGCRSPWCVWPCVWLTLGRV